MQLHSGKIWFDESAWVGAEIEFPDCEVARWKITSKISEKEDFREDHYADRPNPMFSTACAVFVCCDLKNPTHEAIVKIRLQIPKWKTWSEPPSVRAEQASPALSYLAEQEITALKLLMEANCASTPKLIASKLQLQGDSDWVPGGYQDFILMERVPGQVPGDGGYLENRLPADEWAELKVAFKKAWLECIACGICHMDGASRNLIWDREQQKIYIIDWEDWEPNRRMDAVNLTWSETVYTWWDIVNRRR